MNTSPDDDNNLDFEDDSRESQPNNIVIDSKINDENLSRWIDNNDREVRDVFGFNENAELVNGRAAMFGFLMLIITEFVFGLEPVTKTLFGIG